MKAPRIVVLGGAGMLGHKIFQHLRERFAGTICTTRQDVHEPPLERVDLLHGADVISGVDVMDFRALASRLRNLQPEFLINCVGVIKQRDAAHSPIPSITINSLLPHRLAALVAEWNGRLIHFSTDCVFSGARGGYTEDDLSDAEDLYGKSKFLGEVAAPNALTLRTSIIGRELLQHKSLLDWFLAQNHKTVSGFKRVIYSGVTTNQMATLVGDVIEKHTNLSGLYQVVADPINKHDLLSLIRDAYQLDVEIIPDEQVISDRSMKGDKLRAAIGYVSPPWPTLIENLKNDSTPYDNWITR